MQRQKLQKEQMLVNLGHSAGKYRSAFISRNSRHLQICTFAHYALGLLTFVFFFNFCFLQKIPQEANTRTMIKTVNA